jgi:hypothetical protein
VLNSFAGRLNQFNPYTIRTWPDDQLHIMNSDLVLVCSLITIVAA